MIRANGISFGYAGEPILNSVSFLVPTNSKVALVGANGAGKSTLFKLILGLEHVAAGDFEIQGDIAYVPQEVKHDAVLEAAKTIREYLDPYYTFQDFELSKLLSGLELTELELTAAPQNLSGGQKTKLALARALLAEPDTLLLDEPTNFMDVGGKHYVMRLLANYDKGLVIISHDIELLDESIDKVLYVNKSTHKVDEYVGNYTKFLELKAQREELAKREHAIKAAHIKQMESGLSKLGTSKKEARQKTVIKRRIERERQALPALPQELRKFTIELPTPARVGEIPVKLENVSKAYGDKKVLEKLTFAVRRDEKFLLIGPNGSGKSTTIKILMGVTEPDSGKVWPGYNLKAGYYSQEFEQFNRDAKVVEFFADRLHRDTFSASGFLKKFMFDDDKQVQRIGTLSGGEKTRLAIALLMAVDYNLLVLDEPTTYLDPMSQRIVLEALKQYKGTLVLVSHVADFVKELAPDRALLMPEAKVVLWDDKYLHSVSKT